MMNDIIDFYSKNAEQLIQRYEKLSPGSLNAAWAHLVSKPKSVVLDVGAGSGRDAAWFVDHGHRVIAVEPADGLREKAIALHPDDDIRWVNDRLPDLKEVLALNRGFDVILVSAVWMHLPPPDRPRAFNSLYTLLNPAGLLIISFRKGPAPQRPAMFPVTGNEIRDLARRFDLQVMANIQADDMYKRTELRWETVVLKL